MKRKSTILHKIIPVFIFSILASLVFNVFLSTPPVCANSISCLDSTKLKVENNEVGIFNGQKVIPPKIDLSQKEPPVKILGDQAPQGEKHIYVDLTHQTLTAYQGDTLVLKTLISSGKWSPTPPGEYTIWVKLRATRMTGGVGADYYDLPNVPYTMFFAGPNAGAGRGFSLHGTYWHNNFGHPMSHGCVNMRTVDAQKIYDWADPATTGYTTNTDSTHPGTKITIYGQAP